MTVVSVLRFDDESGALICDEQTTMTRRKAFMSDKIRKIIPDEIATEFFLEAVYGGSGTTSIASEVLEEMRAAIWADYRRIKSEASAKGEKPESFMSFSDVANLAMKCMISVKHKHINEKLISKFGFNIDDFNKGFYMKDNDRIEIKQETVINQANEMITWRNFSGEMEDIFKNTAIIAGCDSEKGFQIYELSAMDATCYLQTSPYDTIGSGSDTAELILASYVNTKTLSQRRGKINKVEGLLALLRATNAAAIYNNYVGGYYNIVYINSKGKTHQERCRETLDHSGRLAGEIASAFEADLLDRNSTYELLNDLVFEGKPFEEIEDRMWKKAKNYKKLDMFLRGYKISSIDDNKLIIDKEQKIKSKKQYS